MHCLDFYVPYTVIIYLPTYLPTPVFTSFPSEKHIAVNRTLL